MKNSIPKFALRRLALGCLALPAFAIALQAREPGPHSIYERARAGTVAAYGQLLQEGVSANFRDASGNTLLMTAAMEGEACAVGFLLERGAEVNATNSAGVTALMKAAGSAEKLKLLIAGGAAVNARSANGNTALILASRARGMSEVLELLLNAGADVNATNVFGASALMCAAAADDLESARLLVKHGADVNAHSRGSEDAVIWGGGRSALGWAAFRGNREMAKFLLQSGADVNSPEGFGSALSQAAWADHESMAKLLLRKGADARQKDFASGFTPLHWAAAGEHGNSGLARALLKHGADANAEGGEPVDAFMGIPQTPLRWAQKRGETETVALLRAAGAREKEAKAEAKTEPRDAVVTQETLRAALAKALPPLLETAQFSKGAYLRHSSKQDCVSCHQQYMPLAAFGIARKSGASLDEEVEKQILEMVRRDNTNRSEVTEQATFHPEPAHGYGYALLALSAQDEKPTPEIDAMIHHLLVIQGKEGQWHNNLPRPPIQSSDFGATALVIKALKTYGPPALHNEIAERVNKARSWLAHAKPATNEERAYQLLGLAWGGEQPEKLRRMAAALVKEQRSNGGWAQLAGLEADAYATGLSLFALIQADQEQSHQEATRRGLRFLLGTQAADGTWHVRTRAFPFQPTMRSGFPYSRDSWISATGSSWAAIAIASAMNDKPVQLSAR